MKASKKLDCLSGVGCSVMNCVYNGTDRMCHADHIQVANQVQTCEDESDTCCGTFEAR